MCKSVIINILYGCLESIENSITGFPYKGKMYNMVYIKTMMCIKLSYEENGVVGRYGIKQLFDIKIIVIQTLEI